MNSNHHTLSQSIRLHAGWPCPVASERREPREPDLDAATGLLPSRSRSRFAPQASVGPPLLVRECDDLHLNSEPSGFPLRADPLEARITPIRTATERQRRSTVSGSQSPEPRRSGSDGAPFLDVLYEPIRHPPEARSLESHVYKYEPRRSGSDGAPFLDVLYARRSAPPPLLAVRRKI